MADPNGHKCHVHDTIIKFCDERYERNEERWVMHMRTQTEINGEIFAKLTDLSKELNKLNGRLQLVFGAAFIAMPLLQIGINILLNHMAKK